jgi:hypothetical protein
MRVSRWRLTTAAATALSFAACGCSDGTPSVESSTAEAKVTGTVTVNGKPMTSGTVTFDASNIARTGAARTADIKSDGTYEVSTLVGTNILRVNGPEIAKNPGLGYANETIDVPVGGTTKDIILPPPNTPPNTPKK